LGAESSFWWSHLRFACTIPASIPVSDFPLSALSPFGYYPPALAQERMT
jgi:hypothetical protein